MASSATPQMGPDAIITLKVNFEGTTRRAKMHLREMVPRVLEEQIKTFLHIPANTETVMERYSDSAGTYVLLEPGNMAVYKQLYRAAKAKSKLKLRVSLKDQPSTTVPKPVSVEDEVEGETESVQPVETPKTTAPSQMTLPVRISTKPDQYDGGHVLREFKSEAEQLKAKAECNREVLSSFLTPKPNGSPFGPFTTRAEPASAVNPATATGVTVPRLSKQIPSMPGSATAFPAFGASFAVCCNSCEKTVPGDHYHCSTCDDGDFDLCQSCVALGISCYNVEHWLIKRTIVNGVVVNSITETVPPKPKKEEIKSSIPVALPPVAPARITTPKKESTAARPLLSSIPANTTPAQFLSMRTCNCCVEELPSHEFVHCTTCEDYDLCQSCFTKGSHGHHPMHGFAAAVIGTTFPHQVKAKLAPGRNRVHNAVCDGCDKFIYGVRHKCLDCPDWDYCAECVVNARFIHPKHRFVSIYEPLDEISALNSPHFVHHNICCDGPLCVGRNTNYIKGIRYKCAVCHDFDMCAACEASPANDHNKTHPLIKFKTPVRHCSVTTSGEHQDGRRMPVMGDRNSTDSKGTETLSVTDGNSMNAVQTVVDVEPAESASQPSEPEVKPEIEAEKEVEEPEIENDTPEVQNNSEATKEEDMNAVFVQETVKDGAIMQPNHVFEQTWTLRNAGDVAWPAGCSVKFVGGDYMGHVDSTHPARVVELVSASESTVCYTSLAPGQEFPFTVLLRTPPRPGKVISYWRLTTEDGLKFGHRLWCDVNVREPKSETVPKPTTLLSEDEQEETTEEQAGDKSETQSMMIFPTLEKESPETSMHEDDDVTVETSRSAAEVETKASESDGFEECAEDEWDGSDDGFLTDEEYDILDASDEEFLEEQEKLLRK